MNNSIYILLIKFMKNNNNKYEISNIIESNIAANKKYDFYKYQLDNNPYGFIISVINTKLFSDLIIYNSDLLEKIYEILNKMLMLKMDTIIDLSSAFIECIEVMIMYGKITKITNNEEIKIICYDKNLMIKYLNNNIIDIDIFVKNDNINQTILSYYFDNAPNSYTEMECITRYLQNSTCEELINMSSEIADCVINMFIKTKHSVKIDQIINLSITQSSYISELYNSLPKIKMLKILETTDFANYFNKYSDNALNALSLLSINNKSMIIESLNNTFMCNRSKLCNLIFSSNSNDIISNSAKLILPIFKLFPDTQIDTWLLNFVNHIIRYSDDINNLYENVDEKLLQHIPYKQWNNLSYETILYFLNMGFYYDKIDRNIALEMIKNKKLNLPVKLSIMKLYYDYLTDNEIKVALENINNNIISNYLYHNFDKFPEKFIRRIAKIESEYLTKLFDKKVNPILNEILLDNKNNVTVNAKINILYKSNKSENKSEETYICSICNDIKISHSYIQCGHTCCENCSKKLFNKCPFCRKESKIIKLYFS